MKKDILFQKFPDVCSNFFRKHLDQIKEKIVYNFELFDSRVFIKTFFHVSASIIYPRSYESFFPFTLRIQYSRIVIESVERKGTSLLLARFGRSRIRRTRFLTTKRDLKRIRRCYDLVEHTRQRVHRQLLPFTHRVSRVPCCVGPFARPSRVASRRVDASLLYPSFPLSVR